MRRRSFEGMLFDLKKPLSYYVEADGVVSPTYTMDARRVAGRRERSSSSTCSRPTRACRRRTWSRAATSRRCAAPRCACGEVDDDHARRRAARSIRAPSRRWPTQPDGMLTGSFTIADDGYYHVELTARSGESVTASPKFTIDAIDDQPPTVTFEKPKRDIKASPVEEVFLQARADDDFGVRQLDLVYSVNGGPEKTVPLYGKGAKSLTRSERAATRSISRRWT